MQETKVDPGKFPDLALAEAGYHAVHHSAGRWAGVAIAAPPGRVRDVRAGLEGEPDADEARWLETTVGRPAVVTTYVPNGREVGSPFYEGKLRFLDAAAERIERARRRRRWSSRATSTSARATATCTTLPRSWARRTSRPAERERFAALLEAGTVDAFRALHPDEPGFTWWDYRAGHFHKKLGLRIDAVLLSAPVAERLVECGIDRAFRKGAKPSDHAPLLVELR